MPHGPAPCVHVLTANCIRASSRGEHKRLALTFGEDAGVAQMAERLLCKQVGCR
jgi:hypothetical protein